MQHQLEFQVIKLVYSSFHYHCQALPSHFLQALPTSISPYHSTYLKASPLTQGLEWSLGTLGWLCSLFG